MGWADFYGGIGYVEDILANAVIMHPDIDLATKNVVLRAVNKVGS